MLAKQNTKNWLGSWLPSFWSLRGVVVEKGARVLGLCSSRSKIEHAVSENEKRSLLVMPYG